MAKYPALQDEVERICMTHIRGVEQKTKDQVNNKFSSFVLLFYWHTFGIRYWLIFASESIVYFLLFLFIFLLTYIICNLLTCTINFSTGESSTRLWTSLHQHTTSRLYWICWVCLYKLFMFFKIPLTVHFC